MNENQNSCSTDSCEPSSETIISKMTKSNSQNMRVEIISDIICPWCYIGKRRFEKAVAQTNLKDRLEITWHPFELNPNMPKDGVSRREYRTKKFGSWEYSQQLDAQVTEAALELGLPFNYAIAEKTPNTFDGHRLLWFAQTQGKQNEVVESLFKAYFCDGQDIGDLATLTMLAAQCGLNERATKEFLTSNEGITEIQNELKQAQQRGINGVPAFFINNEPALSGAQNPSTIASILKEAASQLSQ